MGAHPRGAVHDGALDHLCAARIDVLDREIALHRGDRADGFADAAMVVAAAAEQAGLVEMDMGVDEAGQHQPAADVDLGRLAGKLRLDRGDPAAGYADIDRVAEDRVLALRKIRSKAVRVHGIGAGLEERAT